MTVYTLAPEPTKLAAQLITTIHTRLAGVALRVVFRDEHQTKAGKEVWATTRLIGGREAWLAAGMPDEGEEPDKFFLIEVARDVWYILDADAQRALIDHELCHCQIEESAELDVLKLAAHDVEEFAGVVARHGLWRPEVEALVAAARGSQLTLVPV